MLLVQELQAELARQFIEVRELHVARIVSKQHENTTRSHPIPHCRNFVSADVFRMSGLCGRIGIDNDEARCAGEALRGQGFADGAQLGAERLEYLAELRVAARVSSFPAIMRLRLIVVVAIQQNHRILSGGCRRQACGNNRENRHEGDSVHDHQNPLFPRVRVEAGM